MSSEKSFGKGPSSVSPDADDLLQMIKMDSGSAGSHSTGSDGKSQESTSKVQKQSPPLIVKVPKDSNERKQNSLESNDIAFPHQKPPVAAKSVAWSISDGSTSSIETPRTLNESSDGVVMNFDANVSTIKRSPYKRQQEDRSLPSDPSPQPEPLIAWDEKPHTASPVDQMLNSTDELSENLLKDFDPLLSGGDENQGIIT